MTLDLCVFKDKGKRSYLFSIALTHVRTPLYVYFLGIKSVESSAKI